MMTGRRFGWNKICRGNEIERVMSEALGGWEGMSLDSATSALMFLFPSLSLLVVVRQHTACVLGQSLYLLEVWERVPRSKGIPFFGDHDLE